MDPAGQKLHGNAELFRKRRFAAAVLQGAGQGAHLGGGFSHGRNLGPAPIALFRSVAYISADPGSAGFSA